MKCSATMLRVEILKIKPAAFSETLMTPFQYKRLYDAVEISNIVKNSHSKDFV
jgi:hypothetical protein